MADVRFHSCSHHTDADVVRGVLKTVRQRWRMVRKRLLVKFLSFFNTFLLWQASEAYTGFHAGPRGFYTQFPRIHLNIYKYYIVKRVIFTKLNKPINTLS